jgi:hypothetical protein
MATKKKSKPAAETIGAELSEIIKQCVIYVQQLAAYDAGMSVDRSGNFDYAGSGREVRKARRAMLKLIALSPPCKTGAAPLTALELHAKADVLTAMYGLRDDEEPDHVERAYIRFFAAEVTDFLAASPAVQS